MTNYERYKTPEERVSEYLKRAEPPLSAESDKQQLALFAEWLNKDLSPCRCCNGEATIMTHKMTKDELYYVRCPHCGMETNYYGSEHEAKHQWNDGTGCFHFVKYPQT